MYTLVGMFINMPVKIAVIWLIEENATKILKSTVENMTTVAKSLKLNPIGNNLIGRL